MSTAAATDSRRPKKGITRPRAAKKQFHFECGTICHTAKNFKSHHLATFVETLDGCHVVGCEFDIPNKMAYVDMFCACDNVVCQCHCYLAIAEQSGKSFDRLKRSDLPHVLQHIWIRSRVTSSRMRNTRRSLLQ